MAKLKNIVKFLDTLLESNDYDDYCPNGLQVEGEDAVSTIALGVSASLNIFKEAQKKGAQAILVHHGLIWGEKKFNRITGIFKERVRFLLKNDISLIGYHLPLDGHKKYGNNILIAKKIGLKKISFFAKHGNHNIGVKGFLSKPVSFREIHKKLNTVFGQVNASYSFNDSSIRQVAIVSGGASKDFLEAAENNIDLFITGENGEPIQEIARETQKSFISCGHYATERFGLIELGKILQKKFKVKTFFIDIPNKA
ncbi:MAG: Nif3-like dinuclear metal center hexameric protein [Candidatus Aureabacteria bacterium]|nr:Nif3-like dinuclear metal center hexameric protein [Candidatus Auribacterota bacterium]